MIMFGVNAFYECVLWSYWGTPKPLNIRARFPIPPQEGDDIIVDGKQYSVMRRRIEHGLAMRLYVALDSEDEREAAE